VEALSLTFSQFYQILACCKSQFVFQPWIKDDAACPSAAWRLQGLGGPLYRTTLGNVLTVPLSVSKLTAMVVHLKPETESRLKELAATTGRAPDDLVEDAMAGYLAELVEVRKTLDGRYDEIRSGRVKPIDGEEAFDRLRRKSQDRRRS
jgi:predicted transcriptional regulator